MSDLINRKALLNDFRKTITEQSGTTDWLNMINRQPSVGDNRWIPVSERLPEEYGTYMIAWRPAGYSLEDEMKKEVHKLREESDFWKREAIKSKAQLGEIRILVEKQ